MIQNPNEFETNVRSNMTEENASPPLSDCNGQENTENSEASNASPDGPLPDLKFGFEELCPVCGDKVSGYHYGLLTCESCKGFFKRTVQNKKVYSCVDNRSCHIDKSQRKRCPYCRFQKCLSVGMRLEAVRQDRMRGGRNKFGPMYKRDRALKQQAIRQQQQILATCQMRLANGLDPLYASSEGQDVKPDPALLMSISNSLGYNINGMSIDLNSSTSMPPTSYPNSTIPSPTSPTSPRSPLDNSPRDLRLAGNQGHGTSVPQSPSELSGDSQGPMYHAGHMGGGTVRMSPSISDYNNSYYQAVPHPAVVPFLPQLIVDLKASALDEREIKNKLLNFIDTEVGHDEMTMSNYSPKLLRLLCRLTDQLLFLLVEWARTSVFFRELKVEDQMKLLQNCWSEILILDLAQRLLKMTWSGDLTLANGQKLSLNSLDDLGLSDMKDKILDLVRKIKELKIDDNEYTCLKFLLLLNPDVTELENQEFVENCQERVQAVLMEYCVNFYPTIKDKFSQVLLRLPDLKLASIRGEEFLYYKHLTGEMPDQTLLMEMLHSKKK